MEPTGGRLYLVSSEGRVFPIDPGRTTIGRNPSNWVVIDSRYVSRTHAALDFDGQRCTLTDLGSTHGTVLNGQRLQPQQPRPLWPGDLIVLPGQIPLTVRGGGPPEPPSDQSARQISPFILVLALVAILLVAALAVLTYLTFSSLNEPAVTPASPPVDMGTSNLCVEYILDASGGMDETLPDGTVKLAVTPRLLTQRLQAFGPETHIGLQAHGHRVPSDQTEESCRDIELDAPVEVGPLVDRWPLSTIAPRWPSWMPRVAGSRWSPSRYAGI
jgi:hypothetical protein